jgi:hypothetical protein
MLCVALLYVLLRGGDPPEPQLGAPTGATGDLDRARSRSVAGHSDACDAEASIRLGLERAAIELEQNAAGVRMLGLATYLYVRDRGNIMIPTSPVELW